jgi:DNA-binding FrmR family transcriptional regulator
MALERLTIVDGQLNSMRRAIATVGDLNSALMGKMQKIDGMLDTLVSTTDKLVVATSRVEGRVQAIEEWMVCLSKILI